jgi:hypothetical protein
LERVFSRLALAVVALCALLPAAAGATVLVKLHTSFVPYRLGASTTVRFGFDIATPTGATPPPLTGIDLHLPAGMNENASELGLGTCQPAALLERGSGGCPVDSQIGFGTARTEVTFGDAPIRSRAHVDAFAGPAKSAGELLFDVEQRTPIRSRLLYLGRARTETGPFGSDLETTVPVIPTVPGGNDLATTAFESTLGPLGLTYVRNVHGRRVSFHPEGIIIPGKCPAEGFPFLVELHFDDGTEATARSSVPCRADTKPRSS